MSAGDGGSQSRYERQVTSNRDGDYDAGVAQRPYGRREENDYGYGPGNRGLSSAYNDFGGDFSRGSARSLYDRGYQGATRRDYENSENRLGGANYDRYGDRGRYDRRPSFGGGHGGFSSGRNYGRSEYGRGDDGGYDYGERSYGRGDYRDRDFGRGESDERSWWDRTTDEVSSWFGDDEAERRRERDRQLRGQHRGKGPRNYTRSDDRIREDISDRLGEDPFVDATDIEVSVNNGDVTLTGTVDHRSTKRRAEDLAESVSGVQNVENRIRVGSHQAGRSNPSASMGSQSSSPVPGSEHGPRETSQTKK